MVAKIVIISIVTALITLVIGGNVMMYVATTNVFEFIFDIIFSTLLIATTVLYLVTLPEFWREKW